MRRPLKPFVTEYRGAARRQGSPPSPSLKIDSEPVAPRQPESRSLEGSRSVPLPQEDSYEAALRAADALFAPSPRPAAVPSPMPAIARDIPSGSPASAFAPTVIEEAPSAGGAPPSNGGRILRVLDEPPPPELLRLEAERAPKRRGRKPGSKNKPKTPPAIDAIIPALATLPEEPAPTAAIAAPLVVAPEAVRALQPRVYRLAPSRAASEPARDEKYAWVRTKLKPGERWKRRLPKVAW